jgi:hypothetical protein
VQEARGPKIYNSLSAPVPGPKAASSERQNIKINEKINEDKSRAIYLSHRIKPRESLLTSNGRNVPFIVLHISVQSSIRKLHGDHT